MYTFGEKHPILFEFILIFAAFLAAAIFSVAGNLFYWPSEFATSLGRIVVAAVLYLLYHKQLKGNPVSKGFVYVLPALLFALWNIFYNLSGGLSFGNPTIIVEGILTALAPALFEEIIFRGIFICNLQKKGFNDQTCLFISAAVFALVHLTNIVGMDAASVALQVGYSFVVGMVLAAIYLKNHSLLQIILVHFLIDFTNRIYDGQLTSASMVQLIIFVVVLVLEAGYALVLLKKENK